MHMNLFFIFNYDTSRGVMIIKEHHILIMLNIMFDIIYLFPRSSHFSPCDTIKGLLSFLCALYDVYHR